MTPDIYQPDQWHDYFITVGGASAALTGLVFVAMSLNPGVIAQDQTHRHRAVGTQAGFTAIFVICSLGVMGGQDHRAVGLEWLVVSAVATLVYVYGYVQAIRLGEAQLGFDLAVAAPRLHDLRRLVAHHGCLPTRVGTCQNPVMNLYSA